MTQTMAKRRMSGGAVVGAIASQLAEWFSEGPVDSLWILQATTSTLSRLVDGVWLAVQMENDPSTSRVVVASQSQPELAAYVNRFVSDIYRPGRADTTGLSQRVIETGQPALMPRLSFDEYRKLVTPAGQSYMVEHQFPIKVSTVGGAMVPMRSFGATVGTLGLFQFDEPQELTEVDVRWLQEVGDRIGQAVEHADLHRLAIERQARLAAVANVALTMNSTQDFRPTVELILEHLTARLKVDAADVLVAEEPAHELVPAVTTGFHSPSMPTYRFAIPSELVAQAGLIRRSDNLADMDWLGQSRRRSLFAREGFQSYRLLPLVARGRLVGAIEVFHRNRFEPDQEWLSFLDSMATVAAISIDNVTATPRPAAPLGERVWQRRPDPGFSTREREILRLVVDGATNQEIGGRLHLSPNTIKFHVARLLEKARASNRTELAAQASEAGWL